MKNQWLWILGGIVVMGLAIGAGWKRIFKPLIQQFEGFRPYPYWDNKQWSWGYGTRVPGSTATEAINPGGTITPDKAMTDSLDHAQADYNALKPQISTPLNHNQWAAFLSFAYNEGRTAATRLISQINAKDWAGLEDHWKQYIYSMEQINPDLVDRRNAEWDLFIS